MSNSLLNTLVKNITNSATTLFTAVSGTQTTIVGLSIANTTVLSITMDVFITNSAVDYYLVKNAIIPPGQALPIVGGGNKVILKFGDVLKATSGTATSADAVISRLDVTP